ncbi:membrane hypothetical protein [Candidatus Methanoperedens nitroreducens]|uniref:Uncharacterized protein n=1 Tax=Candidatus Methanoperedens nitratireducens TaxID=1392998 RepID=A0A284VPR6_9EURY|nr:membrane hypothetical protein [Candidatus Methanoperedens nitroreducens]
MNSAENYPGYKSKEESKSPEIYPSLVRLILMYIGAMDIVFGTLILVVSLQKSLFNVLVFLIFLLSLIGGLSCMKVAKERNIYKINKLWIIGLVFGLLVSVVYFYAILQNLSRM